MDRTDLRILAWAPLLSCCGAASPAALLPPAASGDPGVPACVPDLDGRIGAHELGSAFGVPLRFRVAAPDVPVDLHGVIAGPGRRVWDWSESRAGERTASLAALAPTSRWYADEFMGAAFAAPLDVAGIEEGVYAMDADAVRLLGIASSEPAPPTGRTLVKYDPPPVVWRLPLEMGQRWSTQTRVRNGLLRGLPYAADEAWEGRVDGSGRLELPDYTLEAVQRVRVRVATLPAVGPESVLFQTAFVFECLGDVARATSRRGEVDEDFGVAAELRRLSL